MSYLDQTAAFGADALLSWQNMDQMADNDAQLYQYASNIYFLANHPGQSFSSGVWTKAAFTSEAEDLNGYYDATNARWLPLVPGFYILSAVVQINVGATNAKVGAIALYKNGSLLRYGQKAGSSTGSAGNPTGASGKWTEEADGVADYFEIFVYSDAAAPTISSNSGFNFFAGALVNGRF